MAERLIHPSDARHASYDGSLAAVLGGKGASLALMSAHLGLSVPPAFTITLGAFRRWRRTGGIGFLEDELQRAVGALEDALNRRFGGHERPLIVSVRSGAPVSMPGM